MGDVYRCGRTRPRAIGIVDGYFDGVPSVWHKEILWAIEQGIAVFGAASMGALRAAELRAFGMRGVGRIFEAFRDGVLEDDDEVAIQHGPAEIGYLPLSEPMVNIRATLDQAVREGAIGRQVAEQLSAMAKASFYPERRWRPLLERALADGLDKEAFKVFEAWLPQGKVDQKRLDALAMFEAMKAFRREETGPRTAGYRLEWTTMWAQALRDIEATEMDLGYGSAIIDELRHDPQRFRVVRRNATARLLAGRAGNQGSDTARDVARASTRFRTERRLFTQAAFDGWLIDNDLDKSGFEQMIEGEARLAATEADTDLRHHMLDELRLGDTYGELAKGARRKRDLLQGLGMPDPAPSHTGLTVLELRRWFFETRLNRRMPADLTDFFEDAGYPDNETFDRAIAREYIFWSRAGTENNSPEE
ncbi:TfuA domain-containing protein [Aminobacter sp. AP02]|uniref:TfuA-like protein n=1 Tax=Aminobacter sp. AP02 TaxID=2135737 RepID=UPI002479F9AE|nr:TfuA domain-containing protein [Aminobacter sp. AP02]